MKIVFTSSRIRHDAPLPPSLPRIIQVSSLKILGVTLSSRLSVADHVQSVFSFCAQTLHALRLLRVHRLCDMQRCRRFTELSSSPGCCTLRLVGLHHGRRPAAHWGISTPWCACRLPPRGRAYGRPAGRRLWWSAVSTGSSMSAATLCSRFFSITAQTLMFCAIGDMTYYLVDSIH